MIKELIYQQCQRCDSIVKNKKAASFLKAGGGRLIPQKILPEDKKDICQWKSYSVGGGVYYIYITSISLFNSLQVFT